MRLQRLILIFITITTLHAMEEPSLAPEAWLGFLIAFYQTPSSNNDEPKQAPVCPSAPEEVPSRIEKSSLFLCSLGCGRSFPTKKSHSMHESIHRKKLKLPSTKISRSSLSTLAQRTCPECFNVLSRASALKVHMRTHTGEYPYICSFAGCGKTFRGSGSRLQHERNAHGLQKYQCSQCAASYNKHALLLAHFEQEHHTNREGGSEDSLPFACSFKCGKLFSTPRSCSMHEYFHRKKLKVSSTTAQALVIQ